MVNVTFEPVGPFASNAVAAGAVTTGAVVSCTGP